MREQLKNIEGERVKFKAVVDRFGTKSNWYGFPQQTICFKNVKFEDGSFATDHIWFTVGKTIEKLELKENDDVEFFARPSKYIKGYKNRYVDERRIDYKLNNPTKFKKLSE